MNTSQVTFEERLIAVEREVAELRSLVTHTALSADWLEKVTDDQYRG